MRDWQSDMAGLLRPADLKAVMIAGCRETPSGPVITEPFDLSNPEHAAIVQRDQEREERARGRDQSFAVRLRLAILAEQKKARDEGQSH